jgi:hypothetical protein
VAKKKSAVPKRSHLEEVITILKRGPVTAMQLPHIRGLKHVIYALRWRGWPIQTEVHQYYDEFGVQHDRAEYRLTGNWTEQSLPFGGIQRVSKAKRKPHRAADKDFPSASADTPAGEGSSEAPQRTEALLHQS